MRGSSCCSFAVSAWLKDGLRISFLRSFFCAPSAVWLAYRLATGTQMQLTNKLFNMGKRVSSYAQRPARAPASRSVLVSIGWVKQPHGLRRMWVPYCRRTSFGALEVCFLGSYSFSVSLRSSFIVCLTRRAVVTSR